MTASSNVTNPTPKISMHAIIICTNEISMIIARIAGCCIYRSAFHRVGVPASRHNPISPDNQNVPRFYWPPKIQPSAWQSHRAFRLFQTCMVSWCCVSVCSCCVQKLAMCNRATCVFILYIYLKILLLPIFNIISVFLT